MAIGKISKPALQPVEVENVVRAEAEKLAACVIAGRFRHKSFLSVVPTAKLLSWLKEPFLIYWRNGPTAPVRFVIFRRAPIEKIMQSALARARDRLREYA